MNFTVQAKRIRPNAKNCTWCKNYNKCFVDNSYNGAILTHRQFLKMIREDNWRYCKKYRFSKENFNNWKKFRKENERSGLS